MPVYISSDNAFANRLTDIICNICNESTSGCVCVCVCGGGGGGGGPSNRKNINYIPATFCAENENFWTFIKGILEYRSL